MSTTLRLLTSSRQPRYARALAALGHRWDVIAGGQALHEPWRAARQLPANAGVVDATTARRRLARGDYDAVICHGLDDLDGIGGDADGGTNVAVVLHATAEGERLYGLTPPELRGRHGAAIDRAERVFTAGDIRKSWRLDGEVIAAPAVEPAAAAAGSHEAAAVRVDNLDEVRAHLAGGEPIARALRGLPCAVVDADAAAQALARYRVFIASPRAPFDSAMPASMLDAMAAGLPVVTLAHSGTPIVHGVTGLVAADAGQLRGFVLELLGDEALAQAMGGRARAWAVEHHGTARFESAWSVVLDRLVHRHDASLSALRAAS